MANDTFLEPGIYLHDRWRDDDKRYAPVRPLHEETDNLAEKLFLAIRPSMMLANLMGYTTPHIRFASASSAEASVASVDGNSISMEPLGGGDRDTVILRLEARRQFGDTVITGADAIELVTFGQSADLSFFARGDTTLPDSKRLIDGAKYRNDTVYRPMMINALATAWENTAKGYDTSNHKAGLLGMYDPTRWSFPQMPGETTEQRDARETAFRNLGQVMWDVLNTYPKGFGTFLEEETEIATFPQFKARATVHNRMMSLIPKNVRSAEEEAAASGTDSILTVSRSRSEVNTLMRDLISALAPGMESASIQRPVKMGDLKKLSWTSFLFAMQEAGAIDYLSNIVSGTVDLRDLARSIINDGTTDVNANAQIVARWLQFHTLDDRTDAVMQAGVDALENNFNNYDVTTKSEIVRGLVSMAYHADYQPQPGDPSGVDTGSLLSFEFDLIAKGDFGQVIDAALVYAQRLRDGNPLLDCGYRGPDHNIGAMLLSLCPQNADRNDTARVVSIAAALGRMGLEKGERLGISNAGFARDLASMLSILRERDDAEIIQAREDATYIINAAFARPQLARTGSHDGFDVDLRPIDAKYQSSMIATMRDCEEPLVQANFYLMQAIAKYTDPKTDREWTARFDETEAQRMQVALREHEAMIGQIETNAWNDAVQETLVDGGVSAASQTAAKDAYREWLIGTDTDTAGPENEQFRLLITILPLDQAQALVQKHIARYGIVDRSKSEDVAGSISGIMFNDRSMEFLASPQVTAQQLTDAMEEVLKSLNIDAARAEGMAKDFAELMHKGNDVVVDYADTTLGLKRSQAIARTRLQTYVEWTTFYDSGSIVEDAVTGGIVSRSVSGTRTNYTYTGEVSKRVKVHTDFYDELQDFSTGSLTGINCLFTAVATVVAFHQVATNDNFAGKDYQSHAADAIAIAKLGLSMVQGATEAVQVANILASRTSLFSKASGETFKAMVKTVDNFWLFTKAVPLLGVALDLGTAILDLMAAYDYWQNGAYTRARIKATAAVGGIIGAVGGLIVVFGAATSWSGVGLGLVLVGGVISFAAMGYEMYHDSQEQQRIADGIDGLNEVLVPLHIGETFDVYQPERELAALSPCDGYFDSFYNVGAILARGQEIGLMSFDKQLSDAHPDHYPIMHGPEPYLPFIVAELPDDAFLDLPGESVLDEHDMYGESFLDEEIIHSIAGVKITSLIDTPHTFTELGEEVMRVRVYLSAWVEASAGTVTELKVTTGQSVYNGQELATITAADGTTSKIWATHPGQVRAIVAAEGEKTDGLYPFVLLKFGYDPGLLPA